jgi:hypothetical protein
MANVPFTLNNLTVTGNVQLPDPDPAQVPPVVPVPAHAHHGGGTNWTPILAAVIVALGLIMLGWLLSRPQQLMVNSNPATGVSVTPAGNKGVPVIDIEQPDNHVIVPVNSGGTTVVNNIVYAAPARQEPAEQPTAPTKPRIRPWSQQKVTPKSPCCPEGQDCRPQPSGREISPEEMDDDVRSEQATYRPVLRIPSSVREVADRSAWDDVAPPADPAVIAGMHPRDQQFIQKLRNRW